MAKVIPKVLVRPHLEISQLQMLGNEIDVDKMKLVIASKIGVDIAPAITDADVSRTSEGASTLTVKIEDADRLLLKSGKLNQKLDVNIEGLWWRFKQVTKSTDQLELKFEEREIAVLRTYSKIIPPISRTDVTRAEFVLRMIKEVKEFDIDWYIPELHKIQPIDQSKDTTSLSLGNLNKALGINPNEEFTIPHEGKLNPLQIGVAETILQTGNSLMDDSNPHKRKILVCSMMVAIDESRLKNLPPGAAQDGSDSQGVFQQRPSQGWKNTMDVVEESKSFYNATIDADKKNPNLNYNDLCQTVQKSGTPRAYGQYRVVSEQLVRAFGLAGGDNIDPQQRTTDNNQSSPDPSLPALAPVDNYFFYRGKAPTRGQVGVQPENSWECIQRLAQEVNWKAFFISGRFYFMSEDDLYKGRPVEVLDEDADGVEMIDGDYDQNKKVATATITCRMGRFSCVPGSVITLRNMGPWNGRWLISTVDRSLFEITGTIDIKKRDPILPEPQTDTVPAQFGSTQFNIPGGASTTAPNITDPDNSDVKTLVDKIIDYYDLGRYKDKNGRQVNQWRKVQAGQKLRNQCGEDISMPKQVPQALVYLMDNGWKVGTFALCEDHGCIVEGSNPPRESAHPKGLAVDISDLGAKGDKGWRDLGTDSDQVAIEWVKQVMILLRTLKPNQIICNGVGGKIIKEIQDLQWNNGQQVSYITGDHTNHIHLGF